MLFSFWQRQGNFPEQPGRTEAPDRRDVQTGDRLVTAGQNQFRQAA